MLAAINSKDGLLFEMKEKENATFRLVKVYTDSVDSDSINSDNEKEVPDKSHTQLFYNMSDKSHLKKLTPSYCRNVYRPNKKIDNLYWFSEALRSTSSESNAIWTIDQAKVKRSKVLKRVKRPRVFSIYSSELGSHSFFEYGSSENEPKGYSGEVTTPFDESSVQRYRWVRYKDGSRWVLIARNDPNTPLVEFRKTDYENEFDIVFLESSPHGWRLNNNKQGSFYDQSSQFAGRYPSVFSNPSTYRSSASSNLLSSRGSSVSGVSGVSTSIQLDNNNNTFSNILKNFEKRFDPNNKTDSERYWQEYVLASTVVIQDEVNSDKRKLWKEKRE